MDWELWGTFSVGDHLRRRAFVADVLLYDRLVVPTPPESDRDEHKRWHLMGWRPERQQRLLDLVGDDRLIRVPWTQSHRDGWETLYRMAKKADRGASASAEARSRMAQAVAADVSRTLGARKAFDWTAHRQRGGQPEEVDRLAHFTSREYLVDWSNMKSDTSLFLGIPKVDVDAVAAYGSYAAFRKDHRVERSDTPAPDGFLGLFGWQFLVPNDANRTDDDLLKQAVELAERDETKAHRRLFHQWRRNAVLAGMSKPQALKEMQDAMKAYGAAAKRLKIKTAGEYAFTVVSTGLGIGAVAFPLLGVPAAFAGLGAFSMAKAQHGIPEKLKIAAMFHDARKRFGW